MGPTVDAVCRSALKMLRIITGSDDVTSSGARAIHQRCLELLIWSDNDFHRTLELWRSEQSYRSEP